MGLGFFFSCMVLELLKKNQGYVVHWLLAVLQTDSDSFHNLQIIHIENHLF